MFHYGSMVRQGANKSKGKWAIGGIWNFFVKTVVGQIGQMKTMILNKNHIPMASYDMECKPLKKNSINPQSRVGRLSGIISSCLGMLGERHMEWLPLSMPRSSSNGSSGSTKKHLVAPKSGFGSNLTRENLDLIAFGYKLHSMSIKGEDEKAKMLSQLSLFNSSAGGNFLGDIGQKVKQI